MDNVQDARRFVVVHIFVELPTFDYGAAIGNFHALEIALNNDGTFLTIGLRGNRGDRCGWRIFGGRRCCGGRAGSCGRDCRGRLRGADYRLGLRRNDGRLGREKLDP